MSLFSWIYDFILLNYATIFVNLWDKACKFPFFLVAPSIKTEKVSTECYFYFYMKKKKCWSQYLIDLPAHTVQRWISFPVVFETVKTLTFVFEGTSFSTVRLARQLGHLRSVPLLHPNQNKASLSAVWTTWPPPTSFMTQYKNNSGWRHWDHNHTICSHWLYCFTSVICIRFTSLILFLINSKSWMISLET